MRPHSPKRLVKEVTAVLLCRLGLLRIANRMASTTPLILYYHSVSPRDMSVPHVPDLTVSEITFERQMSFIRDRFTVLPLDIVAERLGAGREVPRGELAITFDDGYLDNYTYAYPVLKKYGIPATIFLATAYVGSNRPFWWQRLASLLSTAHASRLDFENLPPSLFSNELRRLLTQAVDAPPTLTPLTNYLKTLTGPEREDILAYLQEYVLQGSSASPVPRLFLSWSEIKEMSLNGVGFGSHSHRHAILPQLSDDQLAEELSLSKELIRSHIARDVTGFSYPDGWADDRVRAHVIKAGYKYAVQTNRMALSSQVDAYMIPRKMIKEAHSSGWFRDFSKCLFASELGGIFDRLLLRCRRRENPYRRLI